MKHLLLSTLILLCFGVQAQQVRTETISCTVQRKNLEHNLNQPIAEHIRVNLELSGPHNGESGKAEIKSTLLPSYKITVDRFSGGLAEEISLTTEKNSEIIAKSSTDAISVDSDSKGNAVVNVQKVQNIFLSNSDPMYLFKISCSLKLEDNSN